MSVNTKEIHGVVEIISPYNNKNEGEVVADLISDDSISDLPIYNWPIPFQITFDHIQ